jgi:hypothetical protein
LITIQSQPQPPGTLTLTWPSFIGKTYRLQSTTNIAAGTWSDLGPPLAATGTTVTSSDLTGPDGQRFYRVAVSP